MKKPDKEQRDQHFQVDADHQEDQRIDRSARKDRIVVTA